MVAKSSGPRKHHRISNRGDTCHHLEMMNDPKRLLWPPPRQASLTGGTFLLPRTPRVSVSGSSDCQRPLRALEAELRAVGLTPDLEARGGEVDLSLAPGSAPAQSYRLLIRPEGIRIEAADEAGLFYASLTLGQWLRQHHRGTDALELRCLEVEDTPSFPVRGVLLDISRTKVPTLETALELVDRLARWKINQVQLYMEHTFAYRGHEIVWREASPWTAEEIRLLDDACRERFIELVPNQNSFGHLHRWLRHEPYRRLAECPEGVKHPFGDELEPFSLCPVDPEALDFLIGLYDQLLPCFTSLQLNVGCDETFDLGQGRSAAACEERGKGRVYLEFLQKIHRIAGWRGRRIQFWGDIILGHPELIPELPENAIALEWGYEAGHPFLEHGQRFAESGLEFYVCPGTSSWNSLAGRTTNALANLSEAALHGHTHGASGYLITDWGDFGHLQPLSVSYLGFLAGAGFGWNTRAAKPEMHDWPRLLDLHAFSAPGCGLGQAFYDLGNVYRLPGPLPKNNSTLFQLLLFARETLETPRFEALTAEGLEASRSAIKEALARAGGGFGSAPGLELAREELRWAGEALNFAALLGLARLEAGREKALGDLPPAAARSLFAKLPPLLEGHKEIWQARNRPGGLAESQHWLGRIGDRLTGSQT